MAIKSKFTSEEWQLVKDGPEWIFAALAAADGNVAILTKTKESKAFKDVTKTYSTTNPLVNEVLQDKTKTAKEVKNATLSDAEQALEKINKILAEKLTLAEADEYRNFLTSIANSVAEAAGEGALGIGKKISKKEEKTLSKIKDALKPIKAAKVEAKPVAKPVEKPKAKPSAKPTAKPTAVKPAKPAVKPKPATPKPAPAARPRPTPSAPSIAPQAPIKKEEYLAEHFVASGETLSYISLKYYGSAVKDKYMIIYEANKDVIGDNPNMIKPGMVLNIPKLEK